MKKNMHLQSKFKVAIIVSELRPGGMERVVVHLARGLSEKGIPTMVVCMQDFGELARELDETDVQMKALFSLTGKDVKAIWKLRGLLRGFRPSVINIHDYSSSPYGGLANWLSVRAPVIFTAHGLLYQGFGELRSRYRLFSKFFLKLTAVSDAVAKRHKGYLNWTDAVPVISNGVPLFQRDLKLRLEIRSELGIDDQTILFLAVGNPRPEKGFEDLIEAAAFLRKISGNNRLFQIAVAGKLDDSDYCRMLKNRIKEQGVGDHCRFLGFRKDTRALYSAADAFVLSSRSEGMPMVILESMMAGLPVVATRVGGIPDTLGENGLLVDSASPEQLAQAMYRILKEEGLAAGLGRAARTHAELNFSVDHMVESYRVFYKKSIGWSGVN
jgi:glycosyltransferase involved in cell wall biosynthesis